MLAVVRIISGGQTGADQGGLEAAERLGIPTGGWMPRGFLTEDGLRPEFAARYGMHEHAAAEYAARNESNVCDADATLIVGDVASIGSRNTKDFCAKHGKPCYVLPWHSGQAVPLEAAADFRRWLVDNSVQILNVAGNRESGQLGIHATTREFLFAALGAH